MTQWFSGQSLTTEQEYRSLRLLPWPGLQDPGALARATACKASSPSGLTGKSGPSLSRKTLKAKKDKSALSSCLPACTSHCSRSQDRRPHCCQLQGFQKVSKGDGGGVTAQASTPGLPSCYPRLPREGWLCLSYLLAPPQLRALILCCLLVVALTLGRECKASSKLAFPASLPLTLA